jgi:1-acyl-sn-glycerol-3-phosphate acyltransferase
MSLSLLRSLLLTDPLIVLATVIMGSISVACSLFDPTGRRQHAVSRAWAGMLLGIGGVRVRITGMERIDPARNYVFVGNHLSLMDTPVVLANIPHQFLFLVNAKYVRLPFLGTHLRRSGHFAVEPDNVKALLKIMTEAARVIRERGLSVLLFPEGSRSRNGLREFKEGAAYIAIKAGVPVAPFAVRGTREVLPVGSIQVRGGEVDLILGEPIPTEGWSLKDRDELTRLMRERVAGLLETGRAQPATSPQAVS